jgi:hypothetical protein
MANLFGRAFDAIWQAGAAAIANIREHLVTRGWFGTMEMPDYSGLGNRSPDELPSREHLGNFPDWFGRDVSGELGPGQASAWEKHQFDPRHWFAQEPSRETQQSNEHGIDR